MLIIVLSFSEVNHRVYTLYYYLFDEYKLGMWGANLLRRRNEILKAAFGLFNDNRISNPGKYNKKGFDQNLLRSHIWPLTRHDSVIIYILYLI